VKFKLIILILLFVYQIILYGCGTSQKEKIKPISKEELQSTKSIKIGYIKTPWAHKTINIAPLVSR
jgi:hypothetical protein